eukprot:6185701-Pleurochrysis_carterae.AAC.2
MEPVGRHKQSLALLAHCNKRSRLPCSRKARKVRLQRIEACLRDVDAFTGMEEMSLRWRI